MSQAAIQNGQATIADLVDLAHSESSSELSKRLRKSEERIHKRNQELQQQQIEANQQLQEQKQKDAELERKFKADEAEKDRELKRYEIDAKIGLGEFEEFGNHARHLDNLKASDNNSNGITDYIDERKVDVQAKKNDDQIALGYAQLEEMREKRIQDLKIAQFKKNQK